MKFPERGITRPGLLDITVTGEASLTHQVLLLGIHTSSFRLVECGGLRVLKIVDPFNRITISFRLYPGAATARQLLIIGLNRYRRWPCPVTCTAPMLSPSQWRYSRQRPGKDSGDFRLKASIFCYLAEHVDSLLIFKEIAWSIHSAFVPHLTAIMTDSGRSWQSRIASKLLNYRIFGF